MLRLNSRSSMLAVLLCSTAFPVFSETVFQLKNGDRITGKIVSEDTNQVVLVTAWAKEMAIPVSMIGKREELAPAVSTNALVAVATNAPSLATTNATPAVAVGTNAAPTVVAVAAPAVVATNTVVAASTNAPAATGTNAPPMVAAGTNAPVVAPGTNAPVVAAGTNAPKPAVIAAKPTPPPVKAKPPKQWNFDIQAGLSLEHSQTDSETYSGSFKANYNSPLFRNIFDYHGSYGRTDGKVAANRMEGTARTEHDITKSKRAFVFNAVGASYDAVRKLDLEWDDSFGVGYKFIQLQTFALSADFGANYQEQYFQDQAERNYFSLRIGEVIGWCITSRLGLDQKLEYYPRLTSLDSFRVRLEANMTYKLNETGTIYLNGAVIDIYDTDHAKNVTPNDLQVRSSIGLKF